MQDVSEQQALDIVLRGVSGYLVGARENVIAGASSFDRIYILPTSSRPANTTALPAPQAVQLQNDDDDEPVPAGPRPPNAPPGGRLPRDVGVAGRPPLPVDDERSEPENRPTPSPSNPFGVAPGTSRPGVVNPGPATNRPNQ